MSVVKACVLYMCVFIMISCGAFHGKGYYEDQSAAPIQIVEEQKIETTNPPDENVSQLSSPGAYTLDVGDKLRILVYNEDLDYSMLVNPDGYISYPLIGDVKIAGSTIPQIRDTVTKRLSTYIKNPQVIVILEESTSQFVSVLGAVRVPGTFSFTTNISILNYIAKAEGYMPFSADLENVMVISRRLGGDIYRSVNVLEMLKLRPQNSMEIYAGDVIYIPHQVNGVYVWGEVNMQGIVYLRTGETVDLLGALARAGGVTKFANLKEVFVISQTGDTLTIRKIQLTKGILKTELKTAFIENNIALNNRDIVYVPKTRIGRVNQFVDLYLVGLILQTANTRVVSYTAANPEDTLE